MPTVSLQDTVPGICPPDGPAAASQPPVLPRIPEPGLGELERVAQEMQALHEELQEATATRRVAWEAQVGGPGRGPQWSAVRRASQEAVEQELAALRRSWEQGRGPAPPQGHRLVRREGSSARAHGLRAAELTGPLREQEARLQAALRQLQGQCQQELARLAAALPGLICILPPGR
uniref:Tubulin epsilon and delta complex protein 1 n=1 Tax=Sciurus vulgaris TaxID=55149 RepID=A0A8D2B386_SCIVU